jgi:catechol 2,3-dioxygenase-like lactoylglutathione lyase family enzyme
MAAALKRGFAGTGVAAHAATPRLAFSHVGLWVSDLARMERFYRDLLGYTVTDRGDLGATQLVFLSQDPAEHHQIVLAAGRPAAATFSTINQLSLRAADLAALKAWHRRVRDAGVDDLQPVTHGNALSLYFRDPEGNRIEIFIDTPWYVTQPMRVPVDLERPDAEIWRSIEELCRRSPGHAPRADWQAAMQAKMGR